MPDVRSGLAGGSGGVDDVNSAAGFAAALAEITGKDVTEERLAALRDGDRSVSSGLTYGSQEPPAPAIEPTTTEEPAGAAPIEEEPEPPAYADLLEKHGGDAEKALADLYEQNRAAQEFQGRQSNEIGELRQQMAKLEGRLEQQAAQAQPAPAPGPMLAPGQLEELVSEHGGASVVQWLAQNNVQDPGAYDAAFKAWIEDDPGDGTMAYQRYLVALNTPAPAADDRLDKLAQAEARREFDQAFDSSFEKVAGTYKQEEWDLLEPHLEPVLKENAVLQDAVVSEDESTRESAIKLLTELAGQRALKEAAKAEREKANVAGKQAAQVTTGSQRPSSGSPESSDGPSREERLKEFERRMLSEPTTSVRAGLTYGSEKK